MAGKMLNNTMKTKHRERKSLLIGAEDRHVCNDSWPELSKLEKVKMSSSP